MEDLISRAELLRNIKGMPVNKIFDIDVWTVSGVIYYIEHEPTVVVPIMMHAEWKEVSGNGYGDYKLVCSNCKEETIFEYKFCPNCGALMGNHGGHDGTDFKSNCTL